MTANANAIQCSLFKPPSFISRWKKNKSCLCGLPVSVNHFLSFSPTQTHQCLYLWWWWLNYPCHNPFQHSPFPVFDITPTPYHYQYSGWMVVHWETLFLGFRISIPIKYGTNAQLMQASARLLRQICSQFDTKSSLVSVSPSYNAMINYVQPLSPFPFSSVSGLVKSISSPLFPWLSLCAAPPPPN